ncbi:hypothetical protein CBR_g4351 [Chara braunii]|uniref:Integrase catalytic domain-containing protein n=1 Tax=Chara braunii TaxID=69332 RepID=A0A388JRI9_CHABU|nr:hypothetical protein CBR_g4351 [Chara braunii]|eukprot:GBG60393.1 hypothetical protein CBR_g4351 [Chara braunii]
MSAVPHHTVPRQQCHVSNSAMSATVPRQQCHVSNTMSAVTVPRQQCPATMTGTTLGMPGQLANESLADYKQRFQAQLALIEAEEQRQLAAEAARLQAEAAATAEKQRLQAEADADTQACRKEAQDLLQRHEAASIERLKFWHFEPSNGDDATPEEQHKEFLSKLVTRLLYACNYQRSELERQNQELQQRYQDLKTQHQELANLRRIVQSHEDATWALNSRVLDPEHAVPGPDAGESSSAPSHRQLEQRVDHVVAMLGDISTFAAPTTISNQLDTLKTEVQQLQSTNTDGNNPKQYKMPTFQLEKFDDYTHQDPVLWWEAFTTQLRVLPFAKHEYIGALFMNSGGCQIWLTHLAATHGVDIADLKDKISWEELTRLWKKRFIVDDAPTLAINRLFTMTQGNTATRDWLTEWQKIAATPDLDLHFRICAKVRTGLRQQQFAAVQSDNTVEDPTATQASREGDQVAAVQPRSNNKPRVNRKAKPASQAENGQPAPWVKFNLTETEYKYRGRYGCCYWCNSTKHKTSLCQDQAKEDVQPLPTPLMDAGVKVVDLHAYIAKIDHEFKTQRYDDIDAPLLNVRIHIGEATCSALIDCGASRNYMSQDFMVRAGLGPRVRRKSQPTQVTLADGHTHKSIDQCIDDVPVYFAPHASEAVSFDWNEVLVPCTVAPPHPSISCNVVSAASMRASIIRDDIEEMGVCFLHALPPHDASPTDSSSDPCITELLDAYSDVFEGPHGVVLDWPIRHEIILEDGAVPPRGCIYRMSEEELSVLRAQLDDLLEKGWIRPSSSSYGAPVLFIRKKKKDLRLCIDYRKLNAQTIRNVGPLPRIDDLLERLGGAKFFSKLDLKSGYHQLQIRKEDRYKTAFKTRSLDEHMEHLHTVLERLRQAKYKANRDKCEFARQELEYLGHYVTPQGIRPLADKIEALRVLTEPTNTTDVRSFMGLAGYYQRFITGYSRIVAPMTRLQSPKVPFVFDDDARRSFQALKTAMLMAPVLSIYDPTLPTRVTTNASGYGIGAVLEQHDDDDWHPVEYFIHKVPPINSLDDARKKELLSFVMALKHWRHFLLGRRRFTWVTDNNPLTYYKTQDTVSSTIGRWMYFIDQFDFTPKHLPGLSNRAADALSRRLDLCAMTHHAFAFDEELHHYRIADGYLLLHSRGKDLLCVPRDRRLWTRLLGEYHDSRLAGHFGVNRTIARLRQRFRWPDLITDVTRYCDSCEVCRRSKPRNRNPYGELRPMLIPQEPGLSIAMDVPGPFPRVRLGHGGILTVVDRLSKYVRFLPCKYYSTAPELARLLHTGWICGHGVPEDIVSDRDTRFMSAFWTALMQESDTKMKPSSARHPQTDGQTERAHQPTQMMLRTLIRPDQKDWVDRLPDIEFAYNTSVHPAIGVTPFELHHGGRKGRIFADLLLPRPADIDAACSPASVRKYRELLAQARANMQKAQVCMQKQANRDRVPCPIRAGDLVWVSAEEFALEQEVSRKLLPKWFGPWPVTSATGDEPDGPSFVINIPPHLTVHPVFHTSKLATYKPAKSGDFPGQRSQDPRSMDGHQEVDRVITDCKYGSKPRQYKVTFKACYRDDTRWISGADLKASAPLIYAHYEKQRLAQEASRPAPPTRTVVPPSDRQLRPQR